jgi:lipid II:glycine glycyltransferase (peptidoglycan interpeptide bridge formation enzyme)
MPSTGHLAAPPSPAAPPAAVHLPYPRATGTPGPLALRVIDDAEHLAFLESGDHGDAVSFLQCPAWGALKNGWGAESLGWFAGGDLVGVATVLYRTVPRSRRCLAYLPEGPLVDWLGGGVGVGADPGDWLDPLLTHLRRRRAFTVKIGPKVIVRRWTAETVKAGMADPAVRRFEDLAPTRIDPDGVRLAERLRALGWRRSRGAGTGFGDFQPRLMFRLALAGRTEEQVWAGLSRQWRRNVRTAERRGVEVVRGGIGDLTAFHRLYMQTARRDGFTPRPLAYFQRMFRVLGAEHPDRVRLYLAMHEGEALAAATMVRVGDYAWYGYGASADHERELKPSNAVQWRMIRDCVAAGVRVYDLRGIGDTLDPAHHLFGLLRFKSGSGGEAVEYLGEWDYPLNRILHRAFRLYLARR